VQDGRVRRRSTARLTGEEIERGLALACQTVVLSDIVVWVPPEVEELERAESATRPAKEAPDVILCEHDVEPWVTQYALEIEAPSLSDNTPDLERVQRELALEHGLRDLAPTAAPGTALSMLRELPTVLRDAEWRVSVSVEHPASGGPRIVGVDPADAPAPLLGLAVDIGTTSVVTYLGDLSTRQLVANASAYNGQIACGDDVISRIIYAKEPSRQLELQERVLGTINGLVDDMIADAAARGQYLAPKQIRRVTVAGNTTMLQLFLGVDPRYIRLEPYVPAAGRYVPVSAGQLGLHANPDALVDCLPVVGAYVGADITAGVVRAGIHAEEAISLFVDIGTNGEMVLGNSDWLICCACSAGPAFEGSGAVSGSRAVPGAIEEVWIHPGTLEPTWSTIAGKPPVGICGSGMISLLGEMIMTGVIDKGGHVVAEGPRVRRGSFGREYVVAWSHETAKGASGADIVLTETDIENLLRAKAAIYAGLVCLTESVGLGVGDVERVLIGGAFGRHIDVEKAIQIGLLPDMPWDRFTYLGNTSVQGAYLALTCREHRALVDDVANKMTYLELSADNRFMDAFTSALFIPHTDETLFPSVQQTLRELGMAGGGVV
jgi:uncharacterized 2Fe-2S/4Fe-4S cluster protein (DUF4445 family)